MLEERHLTRKSPMNQVAHRFTWWKKRTRKDAKLKNDKLPPGKSQFLICIGTLALYLLKLKNMLEN
ncbi:mCG147989 [Mus musculus]|jgi:hypothetical protein|nr:mCG147989 [Mus musculus]